MYEKFYGLSGKPFQLNPDPKFFYRSTGHKRAMAYMRYGIQQEQGFIVVTGDVGTGKSMLVSNLFKEIEGQDLIAAKIVSTNVKDLDLLRILSAEFDLPHERKSKASLLKGLEDFFRAAVKDGKRVLIVVDEAQNLPRAALEELRMLSNFEHDGKPLAQSFLLGQREFRVVMRAPGLEQLRQRVIAAYHLKPLSLPEVKHYIQHRLNTVGWKNDPKIADEVYEKIYTITSGVPRRINTLCDRLLLNGFLDEIHEIGLDHLDVVREELEAEQGDSVTEEDQVAYRHSMQASPDEVPAELPEPGVVRETASNNDATVIKLEEQIQSMQQSIEQLSRLVAQSQAQQAQARPAEPMPPELVPSDQKKFPTWTSAFIGICILVVIAGSVIGYMALG